MSNQASSSKLILTSPDAPEKSPSEYAAEAWWNSSRGGMFSQRVSSGPWALPRQDVPPWSVRVKWFCSGGEFSYSALMDQQCIFHDFPLEPTGNFNFESVRRKWNLSKNCIVVRYRAKAGMKVFYPENPDYFTQQELKSFMGDDGCLSIYEDPTPAEQEQRQTRMDELDRIHAWRSRKIVALNWAGKAYDVLRSLIFATVLVLTLFLVFVCPYRRLHAKYEIVPYSRYVMTLAVQYCLVRYVHKLGTRKEEEMDLKAAMARRPVIPAVAET